MFLYTTQSGTRGQSHARIPFLFEHDG